MAKKTKTTKTKKALNPYDSTVIKFGAVFVIILGFLILMYAVKFFV